MKVSIVNNSMRVSVLLLLGSILLSTGEPSYAGDTDIFPVFEDIDPVTAAMDRPISSKDFFAGNAAKTAQNALRDMHARGTVNVLVIYAQFKNELPTAPSPVPSFAAGILDPNLPGSFAHFYQALSFGQLRIRGTVLPKRYTSDYPASRYLADSPTAYGRYGEFVLEILRKVDRDLDLGQFDNDGPDGVPNSVDDDGYVDYVFINTLSAPYGFFRGPATGISRLGFDTPHLSDDTAIGGGTVRFSSDRGAIQREGTFAQTAGSMAHEFGHALGLRDLYDTSHLGTPDQDPDQDSAGIGRWGLMGHGTLGWNGNDGPNPFSAFSLEQLGWVAPENGRLVEIKRDTTELRLEDVYRGGVVYKVPLGSYMTKKIMLAEEYLLLERRTYEAHYYNRNMPAAGVLVWWIRSSSIHNGDETRKKVDLVCADGLYQDAGYPLSRIPAPVDGSDNLDFWSRDASYALAHGGNLGDATDPFDGIRHTRIDLASNPSIRPENMSISSAYIGPSLQVRRQGEVMYLDITVPRWSGVIREQVDWAGDVLVDGDLLVAPEGQLVSHGTTQVFFTGTDRNQTGTDIQREELLVQGDFIIDQSQILYQGVSGYQRLSFTQPITFASQTPDRSWYGILIDPSSSSRVVIPEGSVSLQNSERGFVLPRAPVGAIGLALNSHQLLRDPETTSSFGDDPSKSESIFRVAVELDNWSLTAYEDVRLEFRWDDAPIHAAGTNVRYRALSAPFSLYPGNRQTVLSPSLALQPQADPAQPIVFAVRLIDHQDSWRDTLSLVVLPPGPVTAVTESPHLPHSLQLLANYPNPFNSSTTIPFTLPDGFSRPLSPVKLEVFDILGRRVRTLVDIFLPAGPHRAHWDGLDDSGRPLASGVYLVRLRFGAREFQRRLSLLK